MGAWFKFELKGALDPGVRDELIAIAGPCVSTNNRTVFAPTNCAWLVERQLAWHGIAFRCIAPTTPITPTDLPRPAGMKDRAPNVHGVITAWPDYVLSFQKEGLLRFLHGDGSFWWSPGAGKTLGEILWGLAYPGLLVVVTRAAARKTIANDFKKFTDVAPLLCVGATPTPIPPGTRAIVVGWEGLANWVDTIVAADPASVVYDEIHLGKNFKRLIAVPMRDDVSGAPVIDPRTGRQKMAFDSRKNMSAAAAKLSHAVKRRLGATASPIADRLRDLWAQLDLIEPGQWGNSFYLWARRYCNAAESPWGGIDTRGRGSKEMMDELYMRLSFSIHNVPYSVTHANLPPRRRQIRYISPEDLAKDEGSEARQYLKEAMKRGEEAFAHAKLAAAAARKQSILVDMVLEYCQAPGGKIVVATGLRKSAARLHAAIVKALPAGTPTWFATGDASPQERDRIREEYTACNVPCVLVGTLKAWGASVNLHTTDHVIAGMLPWTPAEVRQFEGRFVRQGSTKSVMIHYPIAEGTYDEHVAQALIDKLPAVDQIVGDEQLVGFGREIAGIEDELAIMASLLAKLRESVVQDDLKD